ncbi:NADP-dependent 3-hydroxy acid dehydrogenase YdfG [Solirubrobacter pauli]|uniref:NADP-dependent 3-hydroxy acid dehydrogenase YdfG n=1 Tax=Solirubrobacter pauli TaxID=166793 RepID=A0A660L4L3_9ACTN|nr:SDR family oxidoreductase [Solirubrobacter pauli]RKQ86490.1 NADP-dependent 3-hydroxy acid dehydrogenase YdfG [Solirubrobacter pauli]
MDDRVFLIAGASTGIGAATARQAAEAGYRVVLAARSVDKLETLADETGGLVVQTDVGDYAQVEALARRTLEQLGRIDVVFANAGVGHPRGFEAGDPEDAKQMVITNVFGIYATIRATAAALRESKGHLVITSSIAGRRALKGSLYSATKFAVTGMAEAARQDFNGTGVRTTLISPGMVETPGFSHELQDVLTADDIARAVMFAVAQPPHVDLNEILVRPTAQES